jgi:hypothetical protein
MRNGAASLSRVIPLAAVLACGTPWACADVWDLGTDTDNDSGSDNELVHGLDQVHDMAAQAGGTVEDVDWYRFQQLGHHSYEVVLDGFTGDLVTNDLNSPALERLGSDATTVLGTASFVSGFGVARRITGMANLNAGEFSNYIRVSQPLCGLTCTANERYHIRFYDTTALLSRFNNANGQVTVLILQNSTNQPVNANVVAFGASGGSLAGFLVSLAPDQAGVVNLSTVGGGVLNGTSGALQIVNNAPYGTLAGKAVAVEPATGFTFDTPLVYLGH